MTTLRTAMFCCVVTKETVVLKTTIEMHNYESTANFIQKF